jgi:hypothetical protein
MVAPSKVARVAADAPRAGITREFIHRIEERLSIS